MTGCKFTLFIAICTVSRRIDLMQLMKIIFSYKMWIEGHLIVTPTSESFFLTEEGCKRPLYRNLDSFSMTSKRTDQIFDLSLIYD